MGRTRDPKPCDLPFAYWVFGRPVSTRNDDGDKPRALGAWRAKVKAAADASVAEMTKGRGFDPTRELVEIRVIWLSMDPTDPSQPDIDNMLKPLLDALIGSVIVDDRQIHRILAEKADIKGPPRALDDLWGDIEDDQDFTEVGEVIVVRLSDLEMEYQP